MDFVAIQLRFLGRLNRWNSRTRARVTYVNGTADID